MDRTPNLTGRSSPQEIGKSITIRSAFSFIHCVSFFKYIRSSRSNAVSYFNRRYFNTGKSEDEGAAGGKQDSSEAEQQCKLH